MTAQGVFVQALWSYGGLTKHALQVRGCLLSAGWLVCVLVSAALLVATTIMMGPSGIAAVPAAPCCSE